MIKLNRRSVLFLCGFISSILILSGCAPKPEIVMKSTATVPVVVATETAAPTALPTATETAVPEKYTPPSVDICPMIQETAATALGVEFTLVPSAPFLDYSNQETGHGCRITATGDGTKFESPQSVITKLISTAGLGWNEQINYQADGAMGTATGLTRDMTLMLISANWKPAEGVTCPSDQPISSCELTPEQKIYSIEIDIAEYQAEFTLDGHWVDAATGFTLDLHQDWMNIYGQHEVVAQNGNKIDALENSIDGTLKDKTATVNFRSSFTDKPGVAEITYIDVETIHWKIITAPDGEYYFPAEATLTRTAQ
jgi:hypothetical protein